MKYSSLKVIFIFPFLLFPIKSFGVPADIQDISDEKYFQAVHEELSGAKDSIYMAMYEISIEPDKIESETYRLVQDIVDAHKRGVKIEVYLATISTHGVGWVAPEDCGAIRRDLKGGVTLHLTDIQK